VTNDEAVSVILVAMVGAAVLLLVLRLRRLETPNRAIPIVLSVVVVVVGIALALLAADLELGEQTAEVPTMLFGLGAIALAREPRGVLYDMVNRIRLRQMRDAERRDEEALLAERGASAGVTA
jgi:uncharacterized membrane protein YhhN